jgi:hypothetical protein
MYIVHAQSLGRKVFHTESLRDEWTLRDKSDSVPTNIHVVVPHPGKSPGVNDELSPQDPADLEPNDDENEDEVNVDEIEDEIEEEKEEGDQDDDE